MSVKFIFRVMLGLVAIFATFNSSAQVEAASVTATPDGGAQKKPSIDKYWLVILKTGPKTDADSATRKELFEGHMKNMDKLHRAGILKAAGPFGKNEFKWRGLFVLDCATKEEAEKYVKTDPAVAAGIFSTDIVEWYTEASGNFKHGIPEAE